MKHPSHAPSTFPKFWVLGIRKPKELHAASRPVGQISIKFILEVRSSSVRPVLHCWRSLAECSSGPHAELLAVLAAPLNYLSVPLSVSAFSWTRSSRQTHGCPAVTS
jgi:hypothetical protein